MVVSPDIMPSSPPLNLEVGELPSSSSSSSSNNPDSVALNIPSVKPSTSLSPQGAELNSSNELLEGNSTALSTANETDIKELPAVAAQATKKGRPKHKPKVEEATRRSSRVSTIPDRFQPEIKAKKRPSASSADANNEDPAAADLRMTPVDSPPNAVQTPDIAQTPLGVAQTGTIFDVTPTPKARATGRSNPARMIATSAIIEVAAYMGKRVPPTKEDSVEDNTEVVPSKKIRRKLPFKAKKEDIPAEELIVEDAIKAAPLKRSYQKKSAIASGAIVKAKDGPGRPIKKVHKSTTPVKKPTKKAIAKAAPLETIRLEEEAKDGEMKDVASAQPSKDSVGSRKRSASEEPETEKRFHRRVSPEYPKCRKFLVAEPTARRTRSQKVSSSAESANNSTESSASETLAPKAPIVKKRTSKGRAVKTPATKTTVAPRLSTALYHSSLRATVKSAVVYYSTLPTNLTDPLAIESLYKTFCAGDTYRKHLAILGLEGDDGDVRVVLKQVWQIVNAGEQNDGVVWEMLAADWSTQGIEGWGNDGTIA